MTRVSAVCAAIFCAATMMTSPLAANAQGTGIVSGKGALFTHFTCISRDRKYLYIVPAGEVRDPRTKQVRSDFANCSSAHGSLNEAIGSACGSVTMDQRGTRWPQTWSGRVPEFGVSFSCRR